jgi:peptidoglycan-associated lipoprotein
MKFTLINQRLASALIVGAVIFSVACSNKKKEDDNAIKTGDTAADTSIGAKDMKFDPVGSDSGNIKGLNTIHFAYDDASIASDARKTLAANAEWIKNNPDTTVQIEGHTDERGSVEYNLALGERRAKAVKTYLAKLGIDGKRLTTISYGKEKPLDSSNTEAGMAKNRRANFVPLPK